MWPQMGKVMEGDGRSKVKIIPAPSGRKVKPTPKGKVVQFNHAATKNAARSDSDSDTDDSSISEIFSRAGTETTRSTSTSAENSTHSRETEMWWKTGPIEDTDYGQRRRPNSKPSHQYSYREENVTIIPASPRDKRRVTYYQDMSDSKRRARSPEISQLPRPRGSGKRPLGFDRSNDDDEYNFERDPPRVYS